MYAIVEIAGQQFKVQKDQQIYVHRLPGNEGDQVEFSDVLLVENDGKVEVGAPAVNGVKVTAKILKHLKDDKVIVFKKKRRKGYKVKNGHRQYLSEILIEAIGKGGASATPKAKAEKEAPKATAKKEEVKAEKTTEAKASPSKKAETEPKPKAKAKPAAEKKEDSPEASAPKTENKE